MHIVIVTDAWRPQVNGVVRTYERTVEELEKLGHRVSLITPLDFPTIPMPTYPDIRLSLFPGRKVRRLLDQYEELWRGRIYRMTELVTQPKETYR